MKLVRFDFKSTAKSPYPPSAESDPLASLFRFDRPTIFRFFGLKSAESESESDFRPFDLYWSEPESESFAFFRFGVFCRTSDDDDALLAACDTNFYRNYR